MAIKLSNANRTHVPDVTFFDENDKPIANRSLPIGEQVVTKLTLASVKQKTQYLGTYSVNQYDKKSKTSTSKNFTDLQYEKAVQVHVSEITGLEDFGITDGKTLVEHEANTELNDLIQDLFFKITGTHDDDDPEVGGDSGDAGELTQGE